MGVGGKHHSQAALPPGKRRVTQGLVGCGPAGPAWTGAEKSRSHRDTNSRQASP
jgi:hypothetical protein